MSYLTVPLYRGALKVYVQLSKQCSYFHCRSPIVFMDGPEKREGFNSFVSQITLTAPDRFVVVLDGHPRADKKSSLDSACLLMLYELEQRGILTIDKS